MQLDGILSPHHTLPRWQDVSPALNSHDPGGTQTSEQAIVPQVSGAEKGWGQAQRRYTAEGTNSIRQGMEESQKLRN